MAQWQSLANGNNLFPIESGYSFRRLVPGISMAITPKFGRMKSKFHNNQNNFYWKNTTLYEQLEGGFANL